MVASNMQQRTFDDPRAAEELFSGPVNRPSNSRIARHTLVATPATIGSVNPTPRVQTYPVRFENNQLKLFKLILLLGKSIGTHLSNRRMGLCTGQNSPPKSS
jgi:hypothetical protein